MAPPNFTHLQASRLADSPLPVQAYTSSFDFLLNLKFIHFHSSVKTQGRIHPLLIAVIATLFVLIIAHNLDLCEIAQKWVPNFEALWQVRENYSARKFWNFLFWKKLLKKISTKFRIFVEGARKCIIAKISTNKVLNIMQSMTQMIPHLSPISNCWVGVNYRFFWFTGAKFQTLSSY